MENREKYAEEIKNYKGDDFCHDFVKPVILKKKKCDIFSTCSQCYLVQQLWLDEEYKESEVDWSRVPVDTLIRVKENKIDEWVLRYFAEYKDGKIYAWDYGCTSKTTDCVAIWRYGEIVTEDIK